MQVRNIMSTPRQFVKSLALVGTLITGSLGSTSCIRQPFKELNKNLVPRPIVEVVDSCARKSIKSIENPSFVKYGEDTIEFKDYYLQNKQFFGKWLNRLSWYKCPQTQTGTKRSLHATGGGVMFSRRAKYTNNFVDTKAVIKSDKFFTTDGEDIYIPVQYYGIPNPKLK